jgi:hypothetical protein
MVWRDTHIHEVGMKTIIRSALQLALRQFATLQKEQQQAQGYARQPVTPGEFDVWTDEQSWGGA